MPAKALDVAADPYFALQYGIITVQQAREAGLTDRMIAYRVDTGRWRRLAKGVFAAGSAPPTWQRDLSAAILFHLRAIATGWSAAHLHGFTQAAPDRPEVMTSLTASARSPLAKVTRSAFFHQVQRSRVNGFETSSPAETILTIVPRLPPQRVEALVDETLARGTATIADYMDILARCEGGRVKGVVMLRDVVKVRTPDAYEPPHSELERLSRKLTDDPRVPPVTHQHPILGNAGPMIVDTFIGAWGLVLEVDGRAYHSRKADFERDRRRDNAAASLGYVVLRFTWEMVTKDFDYCLTTLLETGRRREASG